MSGNSRPDFHYGGQAVIEGVMMRGKNHFAVACRRADGTITLTSEPVDRGILGKLKWLNVPFLRGTLALVDTLVLGMKSLMWSANIALEDETAKSKPADNQSDPQTTQRQDKNKHVSDVTLSITFFIAIAFAVALFVYLPALLTKFIAGRFTESRVWLGLLEGAIKLTFLLGYVSTISLMPDIRRVFQYHGAEHKVINAFESGVPLDVENVQNHTTIHVRCGTSFLLVVILVGILVFAAVPWSFSGPLWKAMLMRAAYKLPLLIPVAGIAYEVIKFAGSRRDSMVMRILLSPGLLMQKITTKKPTDDMVEVAIASLNAVRNAESEGS